MLLAVLSGCAPLHPSDCHKTSALGSCSSGRFSDEDEYGQQARAIKTRWRPSLPIDMRGTGKKCRLHLEFARDGKLKKIDAVEGNKAYCAALREAAARATFPAFTSQQVYDAFARSRFNMQGD
ncbi:Tol-Pal system TolA [Klebsiella aerogenes]|nr:Tol-Pal system TolA [Klebsiella aerogenes]